MLYGDNMDNVNFERRDSAGQRLQFSFICFKITGCPETEISFSEQCGIPTNTSQPNIEVFLEHLRSCTQNLCPSPRSGIRGQSGRSSTGQEPRGLAAQVHSQSNTSSGHK